MGERSRLLAEGLEDRAAYSSGLVRLLVEVVVCHRWQDCPTVEPMMSVPSFCVVPHRGGPRETSDSNENKGHVQITPPQRAPASLRR